ncbi:mitochondrial PGP phosphatase-domain-containing protein [Cladochytrium replicatum]|nr:mitochondrial PGP phosphatase-domain-containing protein [Cladochytrium replicatum]
MVQWLNVPGLKIAARSLTNPYLITPHLIANDIRNVRWGELKHRGGIRAVVFDKDNTLTAPYAPTIHPPFRDTWREILEVFGRNRILIVSNSAGTKDATKKHATIIESEFEVPVFRHTHKKPRGGPELLSHPYLADLPPSSVAVVGDRLSTDVALASLNGMFSVYISRVVTNQGDQPLVRYLVRPVEHKLLKAVTRARVQPAAHPIWDDFNNDREKTEEAFLKQRAD